MPLSPTAAGRLLVCLFAALTAAKEVAAGALARNLNTALVVLVAFVTASLAFHAWRLARRAGRGAVPPPRIADALPDVIALNVASVGAWGTIFYALQYIEPAIASTLAVATLPLFTLAVQRLLSMDERVYRCDLLASAAIGLSVLMLAWRARETPLGAVDATALQQVLAVLACLGCALGMAVANLVARRLYTAGWQPADVMAHRFYLLIAAAAVLLMIQRVDVAAQLDRHLVTLIAFALIGVAMPVLVLQHGVKLAAPIEVATIVALSPMLVLLFQLADPQVQFAPATAAGVCATVLIVALYLVVRDRARARTHREAAAAAEG
jgi:drug/metabolite transporter (DMT)-like permease